MKIVISKNYEQCKYWMNQLKLSPKDYIYIYRDEQLFGLELSEDDVLYVGEHWESPIDRNLLASRIRK